MLNRRFKPGTPKEIFDTYRRYKAADHQLDIDIQREAMRRGYNDWVLWSQSDPSEYIKWMFTYEKAHSDFKASIQNAVFRGECEKWQE